MTKEVFTLMNTPFALGGTHKLIKTTISEYERIDIGKNYFGILFFNPVRKLYHMAIEEGALIGTDKNKKKLIKKVKDDVETGDEKLMKEQVKQSIDMCKQAMFLEPNEFFSKFSNK